MLLVEHIGRGKPRTLLFLHGQRVSSWMWKEMLDELSQHYHCIVIDLPRCGENRGEEFEIEKLARSLARIIQKSVPDRRVHVIGVSVGAQVALQLAFDYSNLVESIVISGTPMMPQKVGKQQEMTFKINHSIKNTTVGLKNTMLELGIPEKYEREFTKDTLYTNVQQMYEIEREMLKFTLPEVPRSFRIPAMIVVGEKEKRAVKKSVEKISNYFYYTQKVEINEGKQYWMLSKPEVFTNMIFKWLEKKVNPLEEEDVEAMLKVRG